MPPPAENLRIEYRTKARSHAQHAKDMLASPASFAPIYACLHARFAIEALAYDRLQDYLFEVSASAMKGWTPRQVLKELLYTDPDACSATELKIGWKPDPEAPAQEIDLGESYSFSALWANKMHNALSSFLHESTIRQSADVGAESGAKAREKAEEALLELDRVLASTVSNFRAHRLIRTLCKCGQQIVRDLEFIEANKVVSCSACERLYNTRYHESDHRFVFWPQQATWTCKNCQRFNSVDAYEMRAAETVTCEGCGELYEVSRDPVLKPLSPTTSPERSAMVSGESAT
jgi:hypothetical protein